MYWIWINQLPYTSLSLDCVFMNDHLCRSLCLNTQLWAQRELSQNSKGIHNEAAPCSSALLNYRNCGNLERHQCCYRLIKFWRGEKKPTKTSFPLREYCCRRRLNDHQKYYKWKHLMFSCLALWTFKTIHFL